MVLKEYISSNIKNSFTYFSILFNDLKDEFFLSFKEFKEDLKITSSISLLSLLNNNKSQKNDDTFLLKVFEPNTHIYFRMFKFPLEKDMYISYINSLPEGYEALEPVDENGYSIEDLDNYNGLIKVIFYNSSFVLVKGEKDSETDEIRYSNPGSIISNNYCEYSNKH